MEILEKIDEMKVLLETLLKTHNLNDKSVVEVSQKLDKLILEHYKEENKGYLEQDKNLNKKLGSNLYKTWRKRTI